MLILWKLQTAYAFAGYTLCGGGGGMYGGGSGGGCSAPLDIPSPPFLAYFVADRKLLNGNL
jgi:hypothetical protein